MIKYFHMNCEMLKRAYTLVEMMILLSIISLLLAILLPNIRGLSESQTLTSATQQVRTHLAFARAHARNNAPTMMVFIDRNILDLDLTDYSPMEIDKIKELQLGVFTRYALFSFRHVGDQPGSHTPQYITDWQSLPNKTIFPEWFFTDSDSLNMCGVAWTNIPFPFATSKSIYMRYISFNVDGNMSTADGQRLFMANGFIWPERSTNTPVTTVVASLPIATGVVIADTTTSGNVTNITVLEIPAGNSLTPSHTIEIDEMSGRPLIKD